MFEITSETRQAVKVAPAQVGNGKTVHYVSVDGFHLKTECGRVADRQLDDRQAGKMGRECGRCVKAVQTAVAQAEYEAQLDAMAQEPHVEAGRCTPLAGGEVHEMQQYDPQDRRPERVFPLCRTGSMTNTGTKYRKVAPDAPLTCRNCITNAERREAFYARRAPKAPASAPTIKPPAPAPATEHYQRIENGITTYLTQAEGEAEIARLRRLYLTGGIPQFYAGKTGATYNDADGLRIHLNLMKGPIPAPAPAAEPEPADETPARPAPAAAPTAPAEAAPREERASLATPADVVRGDGVRVRKEGRGKWIVLRGGDYLGVIWDHGTGTRRGRFATWSPYRPATVCTNDPAEAVNLIVQAWPVSIAELAAELGITRAAVTAAADALAECGRYVYRTEIRGPRARIADEAADALRSAFAATGAAPLTPA
ncbi:hypothetical protein [Streptomyces sp. NPDC057250]|uniref:hypothetical protein n=1 Tax=Streptomyces sp. NPDC057250 TaxID=3346068 RepID=UPI00362D3E91